MADTAKIHPQDYYTARARLGKRDSVRLERNTYLERIAPDRIGVRLHSTYVVTYAPTFTELDSGGWHTKTTADRIRSYSPVDVSSDRHGWHVFTMEPQPCYCTEPSYHSGETRVGFAKRLTEESLRGDGPLVYEWRPCEACDGSGVRFGRDWGSGGHPYFDGIRVSRDGRRLMSRQPHAPADWSPVYTVSGWSGLTTREASAARRRQYDAIGRGDYGEAMRIRDELAGRTATLAPERIESTPLGTAAVYRVDPSRCPHVIFSPEHYRADGSCRCDDPSHGEMRDWGYTWREGRWQA